jgi:hypothetical protein
MSRNRPALLLLVPLLSVILAACGSPAASTPTSAPTSVPATAAPATADLGGVKTYLTGKAADLKSATAELKSASDSYYELARAANFDYTALWQSQPDEVTKVVEQARAAWVKASPRYEQMEGIVAGVPSLAEFDVILDAGASGAEGGDSVVPFDLTLPDGRVLAKPGNLFGVTESALWATFPEFSAQGVQADLNGNGAADFGDGLPDANVLKAAVDMLDGKAGELQTASGGWQPTEADAFTALVTMVPTMTEYFDSWKSSRFVAGDQSTQRDFVAISRLADIQDILSSLEVVHQGVSPLIKTADTAQDQQIGQGLRDLKAFVAGVHQKEQGGQHFTAEDADLLGAEAQNRATAITGQVTQVAAKLNIQIEQ